MLSLPERQLVLLVCFLVAPALGISDTVTGIQVSGDVPTICASGDCAAVDLSAGALTQGGSTAGSYNFNATAASGDVYNVSGTFNNTFLSSTFLGFFPTVTLVSANAAAADTIKLDMFQDFAFGNDTTSWDGLYNEMVPFTLSVAGTTAAGQVLYSTNLDTTPQSVGPLGPVSGPGSFNLFASNTLSPLDGHLLVGDFQYTFTFPEGAIEGAYISSPVPEPSQTIPAIVGIVVLLLFSLRRHRVGSART